MKVLVATEKPFAAVAVNGIKEVLDAAGRAKADDPAGHYVVKVAGGATPYAPRRTAVVPGEDQLQEEETDPRSFALIVPRGVEVWGGYDENFGPRDILVNKTLFKAQYVSAADTSLINTYHAVVFTDYLYDEEGKHIHQFDTM